MCEYHYAKLKGRIVEKFGTRKAFSEIVGISENSMSLKLNGKTGFDQKDIETWSKLLDIDVSDYGTYFFE